jgi:hypothetical protein
MSTTGLAISNGGPKDGVIANSCRPYELHGDERCMMYRLRYIGGPKDGVIANSCRPYDAMGESEGVYASDKEGEASLIYVDDWTRDIELKWRGSGTTLENFTR